MITKTTENASGAHRSHLGPVFWTSDAEVVRTAGLDSLARSQTPASVFACTHVITSLHPMVATCMAWCAWCSLLTIYFT